VAQIFVPSDRESAHDEGWAVLALERDRYRISARSPRFSPQLEGRTSRAPRAPQVTLDRGGRPARKGVALLRVDAGEDPAGRSARRTWVVVAGADARLRLNGQPVPVGLAALSHRDELRLDGAAPLFFSTERQATVAAYPGEDEPRCPRCAQPVGCAELSVRCPGCGVLHHQLPDRQCWGFAPSCSLCEQPTDLEAGLRWSPQEL